MFLSTVNDVKMIILGYSKFSSLQKFPHHILAALLLYLNLFAVAIFLSVIKLPDSLYN